MRYDSVLTWQPFPSFAVTYLWVYLLLSYLACSSSSIVMFSLCHCHKTITLRTVSRRILRRSESSCQTSQQQTHGQDNSSSSSSSASLSSSAAWSSYQIRGHDLPGGHDVKIPLRRSESSCQNSQQQMHGQERRS